MEGGQIHETVPEVDCLDRAFAGNRCCVLTTCVVVSSGPQTITVNSNAANDGEVSGLGVVISDWDFARVGDLADNEVRRAFIDFVYSIPASATVVSATLQIYCGGATGDPYGELGGVMAEHLVYDTLDGTDYNTPTGDLAGTVSSEDTTGFKTLDVTSHVQDDVWSGLGRTQFRLYCFPDGSFDSTADFISFYTGENVFPPQLVITYE
jgi:hypothetical protein